VTVSLEKRLASGWKWSSYVDAEGLVERAVARWKVRRAGLALEYEISFAIADGSPYSLALTQSFSSATLRGFTEISGALVHAERGAMASARLRIDYRDLRGMWTAARSCRSRVEDRSLLYPGSP